MGENKKKLAEAEAFALKYCNPQDSEIISDLDRNSRETAWVLLQKVRELEAQKCVCEKCQSEEEELVEEEVAENDQVKKEEQKPSAEAKTSTSSEGKVEKLIDIAESSQDVLKTASKHASKAVVGATVVATASQTASAATPTVASAVTTFVQETGQKVAAIGTAGLMSIGSGAYFQAKTAKTEGLEIAVVTEQQYGVFSSINKITQAAFGKQAFDTIVEYAENGYGDIEGVEPPQTNENNKTTIPKKPKQGMISQEPITPPPSATQVGGN